MKTLKLNKNQVEALAKCLEQKIELYDTWIENIKNSLNNKSNSNLVFDSTNKYEQEAIEELKRYTERREQLNLILNQHLNTMKTTEIRIERTRSYGHYRITGIVNGIEVSAITTDSEAFDYLNDEDNEEKHEQALAHCVMKLELAYENL